MLSSKGVSHLFSVFWQRRRLRVLTDEEARLIEHFRTLSETDRMAMRYLTCAFKEVSRF
ncbi:hypothetical protein AAHI06_11170 [Pseudomonas salmasensis]|uniref:hypothetical protein n=1 Tax=Pseudomonas salmasensis TaxID=2745514 RepID=UPI00321B54DA